jgi:hypothetical protein
MGAGEDVDVRVSSRGVEENHVVGLYQTIYLDPLFFTAYAVRLAPMRVST